MSIVPYLRPQLDGDLAEYQMFYVAGQFGAAFRGLPYSGEINIFNQVGVCTVRQTAGDTLPVGSSISCDGDKVRITWPAYEENVAPITNPGFEDLSNGWTLDRGWSIAGTNPISGALSAQFANVTGESYIHSNIRYPVQPSGDPINASCEVRQGASSAGNAGAGVVLEYRDSAGNIVRTDTGNMVMSGSGNRVHPSTVRSIPPPSPPNLTVNIAGIGVRKAENKELFVDDFRWDLKVAASGVNTEATFNITLEVKDSTGRTAVWSGSIVVAGDVLEFDRWEKSSEFATNVAVCWADNISRFVLVAVGSTSTWTSINGRDWTEHTGVFTNPVQEVFSGIPAISYNPWTGKCQTKARTGITSPPSILDPVSMTSIDPTGTVFIDHMLYAGETELVAGSHLYYYRPDLGNYGTITYAGAPNIRVSYGPSSGDRWARVFGRGVAHLVGRTYEFTGGAPGFTSQDYENIDLSSPRIAGGYSNELGYGMLVTQTDATKPDLNRAVYTMHGKDGDPVKVGEGPNWAGSASASLAYIPWGRCWIMPIAVGQAGADFVTGVVSADSISSWVEKTQPQFLPIAPTEYTALGAAKIAVDAGNKIALMACRNFIVRPRFIGDSD